VKDLKEIPILLKLLSDSLGGKTWDGKEAILKATLDVFTIFKESHHGESFDEYGALFIREAKRKSVKYKRTAIDVLVRFSECVGLESTEVKDILLVELQPLLQGKEVSEDVEMEDNEKPLIVMTQAIALKGLGSIYQKGSGKYFKID
jgi:hypothetical protein